MNHLRLPEGIALLPDPLPRLVVTVPTASGVVYLNGAHVAEWTPKGADPVLWMSAESWFEEGQPIRGGIPICLPWFGPGRNNDKSPGHGFVRLAQWNLVEAAVVDGAAHLVLALAGEEASGLPGADEDCLDFSARLIVRMGTTLEVRLEVTAGKSEYTFEEALHTYLSVGDIHRTTVEGLDGASYLDKVAGGIHTQDGPVDFTGETDRVFESTGEVAVVDTAKGRTIRISKTDSANTVVWNPWEAKAAKMPDFGDREWTSMVCVEAANALGNFITLQPGHTHTLVMTLALE